MTIILEALKQNKVSIKSETLEVIVVDAATSRRAENQRLPSSTLVSILSNILNCTRIPYSVKGHTQVWDYSGVRNEDRKLEISSYTNSPEVVITLEDDTTQSYYLELLIEQGTIEDLEDIFARLEDNAFAIQGLDLDSSDIDISGPQQDVEYFEHTLKVPESIKAFTIVTDGNGWVYMYHLDLRRDEDQDAWWTQRSVETKLATCRYTGDWKKSRTDYNLV